MPANQEPSQPRIFTLSEERLFEKTLMDGRVVSVHPAYKGAKVYRAAINGEPRHDGQGTQSFEELAGVRGGGFCIPINRKAAIGMTPEEVQRFAEAKTQYLARLAEIRKAQTKARRAAFESVDPALNRAIDTYGTADAAWERGDHQAAALLRRQESGEFAPQIEAFYAGLEAQGEQPFTLDN